MKNVKANSNFEKRNNAINNLELQRKRLLKKKNEKLKRKSNDEKLFFPSIPNLQKFNHSVNQPNNDVNEIIKPILWTNEKYR